MVRHRESQPRRSLTYEELVQFARDEGESHRASNSSLRVIRTVTRTSIYHGTHYLDTGNSSRNETQEDNGNDIFIIDNQSIPTEDLPSTTLTDTTEPGQQDQLLLTNYGTRTTRVSTDSFWRQT